MNEIAPPVQIKGIRDGLLINLEGTAWPEMIKALMDHIDDRSAFFNGDRVVLEPCLIANFPLKSALHKWER